MPRRARLCIPGYPLHIVQRGHNGNPCFLEDGGFQLYLEFLDEARKKADCHVHAFVLMSNHVHLLVTPDRKDAASEMMRRLNLRFVRRMNDRYGRRGTGWEGRFWSSLIERTGYFLRCQRYIELNPVRAGLVNQPRRYRWSSHSSNAYGTASSLIEPHSEYLELGSDEERRRSAYRRLFLEALRDDELQAIREATRRNLPYASPDLVHELEGALDLRLSLRTRGRKGKPK